MNAFTDQFEKLTSFSTEGLEPVRQIAGVAVDSFEKLARTNYAFCGDMMNYAVETARLPLSVSEPKELLERQIAATKAFSEVVTERVNEYVEMGRDLQENVAQFTDVTAAEPVKKTASKKRRSRKAA